jgi:hypothetical protein
VPMAAMTPSRMPMSPRYLGARVPSKIRPFHSCATVGSGVFEGSVERPCAIANLGVRSCG